MRKLTLSMLAIGLVLLICSAQRVTAQNVPLTSGGISSLQSSTEGVDGPFQAPEFDPALDLSDDGSGSTVSSGAQVINRTLGGSPGPGVSAKSGKKAKSNPIVNLSFDGLNHRNQRLANGGNQFSIEPPDQGLCAGNGFVMEAINDVLRVYDTKGNAQTGVVDLNTFFGYAAAINRTTGAFGPEITDPSCIFDAPTQRWFVVVLTLDRVGTSSALSGTNHLDIAVSTSASPLDPFTIFHLPVQNDGSQGTPNHNCVGGPCLGDYPHVGADANGFYITTNEFNFFAPGFRASQIYALSKRGLEAGTVTSAILFDTANFTLEGNPGFTVWPAISPGTSFSQEAGGTEYLLSSVARFSTTASDTRLRIWAISNTQSLTSTTPAPQLNSGVVQVELYSVPGKAGQRIGDIPLGDCINDTTTVITSLGPPFTGCWQALFTTEPAHNETESQHIDANDARMQQVVFANGKLWASLDTGVSMTGSNGPQNKAGIAYFIIKPSSTTTAVSGTVALQGVLGLLNNDLTYPAVGVTASGRGVIAFTLLGSGDGGSDPGNFPSAAYVPLDAMVGAGPISVVVPGAGPDDGFTSYKAEVGPTGRNRWGDYGATFTLGNSVWIASEYIGQTCTFSTYISAPFGACAVNGTGTRTTLANWYTRITQLTP
ncbi:MAG TPA: hypothetical protein VKB49_27285 [Candidatus Sulfotelmatobacter sp.]|nr:hypothetical protein [Candidatus Sulfotelmatobacter sp.]